MQRKAKRTKRGKRVAPYVTPKRRERMLPGQSTKSASSNIVGGLSALANQFIPGTGRLISGVGSLMGLGAYTTEQAETYLASNVPNMHATLDNGVRISHHEFLGDVLSSGIFALTRYPINPGIASTFPWLSSVAGAFQEWELNGCVFYFKSTSANALNSINTALGQIIGAVIYNPYAISPATKIDMLSLSGASDGKPSESNLYPVECKKSMVLMPSKLIRTGTVTDDLGKYDHGAFVMAAVGSQAASTVGELHIVYDVTLKKPRLSFGAGSGGWYGHVYGGTSTSSTGNYFSGPAYTVGSPSVSNSLGLVLTPTAITLPPENMVSGTHYRLTVSWYGTSATCSQPTITYFNATAVSDIYATDSITSAGTGVAGTTYILTSAFKVSESNKPVVLTFSVGVIPTNSKYDLCITESGDV